MRRAAFAMLALVAGLTACASSTSSTGSPSAGGSPTAEPSPTKRLTLPPPSERPLSGTLEAELQQSSRDVALGRFQVWITNGLDHEIKPRRIVYRDVQLSRPVLGGRLRPIPSGSYRGYTLDLVEPDCAAERGKATVVVTFDGKTQSFPVDDQTGVVDRWAHQRCDEIEVERIASLAWTPGIRVEGSGSDAVAWFRLTATPTGAGGSVTIDTVGGTPLFTAADGDVWEVGRTIDGGGRAVTLELAARPARCDAHAFGSAGGGTTFFVNLTIEGAGLPKRQAQIRLAMSPEVTAETFAYAAEACGWEE